MKYLSKLEPWIFYTATAILLIPIWSVDFFVTGDGPCHLHNSKIIIDFWDDAKKAFYDPFYFRNTNFDPNWLFNLITIFLLKTVGPALAERTFFTIYVLGFAFGFRYLIRGFNPQSQYLATVGL